MLTFEEKLQRGLVTHLPEGGYRCNVCGGSGPHWFCACADIVYGGSTNITEQMMTCKDDAIRRIRDTLVYAEQYAKEEEHMRAIYMLTDAIGETLDLIERMPSPTAAHNAEGKS